MYDEEDISRRLRLGEDSEWGFEQVVFDGGRLKSPSQNALADELAAFANTDGGTLLCGATDEGEVQGMTRSQLDALEGVLTEACVSSIKPSVEFRLSRREVEGRALMLVTVSKGYAAHESPGGCFRRFGGTKRRVTGDDRLRLAQSRSQARFVWFDKQTIPETGFNTLEEELWEPLLSAKARERPKESLRKMGLLEEDECGRLLATVAGVLFCTHEPQRWLPNACITATHYRGNDRTSGQVDATVITGPLDRQIKGAVDFAVKNMRVAARKVPARVELPQYSAKAVFEAVVNAVAHRDYSVKGGRIKLSMFDDRMEILSPGTLPNNLTIEKMSTRQSTRNEALASVFARMSVGEIPGTEDRLYIMERRGDGFPAIERETRLGLAGCRRPTRSTTGRTWC